MKKLNNKNVFITGGLSGIGYACAMAAAQEGANVVIADLKSPNVDILMAAIKKLNPKAMFMECDVSNFIQVEVAIQKTVNTYGSLDVALNNAGIGGVPSKIGDMSQEAWDMVIGINLTGVFNGMRHQLTQMGKQGHGVIVNMSSILGKVGMATSAHYVAAKHAVIGLTQTAALEYGAQGIRVNAICPGFIDTPLIANSYINSHPEVKKHIISLHPLQRMGHAEEIAKGFVFLACDDSSLMTGTAMEMDGGFLAQ